MDISFVFVRFQLMLRIEDAHSKNVGVYVFFPFRFSPIWGFWGSPRAHEGLQRGDLRGAISPFDLS